MIKIRILSKGDSVLCVTEKIIAIKRKNGEVDIMPFGFENGVPRIEYENIITISYGENTIETIVASEHGDICVFTG